MELQQVCQRILDSDKSIVGVWMFHLDEVASSVRPTFPKPNKEEQGRMFIQAQVMISIATSNEVSYGKVRYVMVSFDSFDAYMFPFGPEHIVAVGCIKPYSPEKVVDVATGALQDAELRGVL